MKVQMDGLFMQTKSIMCCVLHSVACFARLCSVRSLGSITRTTPTLSASQTTSRCTPSSCSTCVARSSCRCLTTALMKHPTTGQLCSLSSTAEVLRMFFTLLSQLGFMPMGNSGHSKESHFVHFIVPVWFYSHGKFTSFTLKRASCNESSATQPN